MVLGRRKSKLKDYNNEFSTTEGQVTVQSGNVVEPNSDGINSFLFIPLKELHLKENYSELKKQDIDYVENNRVILRAGAFQNDEQIGRSDERIITAK